MSIDLYYLTMSAPARSTLALIKHLGLEVNVKHIDLRKGEHKTPEFLKVSQLKVPAMLSITLSPCFS